MSTSISSPRVTLPRSSAVASRARTAVASRPELLVLLALAAVLNLWALSRNGYANEYYAAAVRSMADSWHAFLYGSFDVAGLQTVDKPPLALWVQALSVRAFGFSSLSLLVPQALMGVASVGLVYDLVRRRFGRTAGFAGGLVLTLTPIFVAISRHNNPDALLVLCSMAAVWFVVRGLEDGRTRWLVLSGVAVGLGFETKMGAALLVVPALAVAWLWVAPRGLGAAVRSLLAGGAALVAVGGAWPLLMLLTPVADRPWISGTSDNSIVSLIFGYNGLGRLDGQAGGPGGGGGGGGGGSAVFGGDAGPLRLLNEALGGQAGWLLGFAVIAGIAVVAASRLRRADARTGWVLAVGGGALTTAVAFSAAQGIFHPYYLSALAPLVAALVGAGVGELSRAGLLARVLAPLAVAGGVVTELVVLDRSATDLSWLGPVIVVGGLAAALALAWIDTARIRVAVLGAALGLLLFAPATWAADTLGHPTSGTFPAGGPADASRMGGGGGGMQGGPRMSGGGGGMQGGPRMGGMGHGGGGFAPPGGAPPGGAPPAGAPQTGGPTGGMFGRGAVSDEALAYVAANGGGTIGVSSQTGAAGAIIASGADVAGLGGFSGRESEVSVSWLAQAVADGRLRWVLATDQGRGGIADGHTGATTVTAAVQQTCTPVDAVDGLYDCAGAAGALAALG